MPALERAGDGIEGVHWVDKVGEITAILAAYRRYMSWVLLFSYLAVYGLLYFRYRHDSWRVLAPTVLATIVTLTLLGIAGQGLNLFHVLGLMLRTRYRRRLRYFFPGAEQPVTMTPPGSLPACRR